ncbi:protein unc-45 A [Cinnamomum micranthum f. kanehirae]|uniref:Protein unc-45 A n=1 Tax=Cinnamomum micranthum f. kanehirae TaxID=337451 RepID=A0A3S3QAV3_9MAGN|nr:protein unc-45 A [Cinnamomum micranthum f. kanehirae]
MAATSTSSFNKIEKAHQLYRDGRHEEALGFTRTHLRSLRTSLRGSLSIANRAACYLKLHDFNKALTPIPESEEEALAAELEEEEEEEMEAALEETVEAELEDEEVVGEAEEATIVAEVDKNKKIMSPGNNPELLVNRTSEDSSDMHPQGWEAVPKPKGHSRLDYSRWDKVEDDSSEEEDKQKTHNPNIGSVETLGCGPVK